MYGKKIAPFLSYLKHVTKIKIIPKPHKKTPKKHKQAERWGKLLLSR